MSKHTKADENKYLTREQVQELNEKYGWFQFGDAQSDVSNGFANEAIERYERIRNAAPELLEALETVCNVIDEHVYVPGNTRLRRREALLVARAAIAKATGGEE